MSNMSTKNKVYRRAFLFILLLKSQCIFAEDVAAGQKAAPHPLQTNTQTEHKNDAKPVNSAQSSQPEQDVYRVPVTAIVAERSTIEQHTRVQGVIEAINKPQLKAKISAEVVKINVDEGDAVKQGQVLALLDDEGFRLDKEGAETEIQRLEALLENQRLTLKRDQSLRRQKLVPQAKLDASRVAVKQTRAQLKHAQVQLKLAKYQLTHTRIVTPISGIVQQRSVSRGDYVNPISPSSLPLFQIVDTRHLRARLYFPETLAKVIKPGMKVTLKRDDQTLPAVIRRLRPMLEAQNRALHALAEFDNVKHWKPGETITADVVLKQHKNAIVVPEMALVRRPAGQVVYKLGNGTAHEIAVRTGIRQGDSVEIVSGLKAGEQIALDGAAYLSDQVAVEIQQDNTQSTIKNGKNTQ